MITLGEDGLAKVKAGVTTAEELLRVVTEVREMRTLCPGVRRRGRRRLHGLPALRPPAERRLPEVRPRAAARLDSSVRTARRARRRSQTKKKLRDQGKTLELPASNVAEFKNQNR